MTVDDVRKRIDVIAGHLSDNESAHGDEDQLYVDVLQAIADGAEDPAELAREALKANDLDYDRWYA